MNGKWTSVEIGGKFAELVDRDFGSFENYKKDLKATGIAARRG